MFPSPYGEFISLSSEKLLADQYSYEGFHPLTGNSFLYHIRLFFVSQIMEVSIPLRGIHFSIHDRADRRSGPNEFPSPYGEFISLSSMGDRKSGSNNLVSIPLRGIHFSIENKNMMKNNNLVSIPLRGIHFSIEILKILKDIDD